MSACGLIEGISNRVHGINGWKNGSNCGYGDDSDNYSSKAIKYVVDGTEVTYADLTDSDNQEGVQGENTDADDVKSSWLYENLSFTTDIWIYSDGNYPVFQGMTLPIDGDAIDYEKPAKCVLGTSHDLAARSALGRTVSVTSDNTSVVEVDGTTLNFVALGTANVTISTTGDSYCNGVIITLAITVENINYSISTPEDLVNVKYDPAGSFTLANDIDMTGVDWTPISDFTGTFDGQGHWINNLTYDNSDQGEVGLFSTTTDATIKNLGLYNAYIVGNANAAGIVGRAYGGTIDGCAVLSSYIEGRDHVASIAGDVNGNDNHEGCVVSNCLSDSKIYTRSYQAGGIAGVINVGTLENCLFSGVIDATGTNAAGMCSLLDSDTYASTIQNCLVAASHLYGNVGRIIQLAGREMTLDNNYVTKTTFCGTSSTDAGMMENELDAAGYQGCNVEISEARTKDFYANTLGWDFESEWKFLDGAEGYMFPVLQWMTAPLPSLIYDMPEGKSILYKEGYEFISLDCIHGSLGQVLSYTITSGSDKAYYYEDENALYAGNEDYEYGGSGDVVVQVTPASEIASLFTMSGSNTFTVYIGKYGDVTEISTADEFIAINKNLGGDYALTADIDMSGVEFTGLGISESFTGTLDGQGHVVKNASVKFSSGQDVGIFGKTNGATIKNIAFKDFSVAASSCNHVGFIGTATTTKFEQVAIIGTVTGDDHVAIFAGDVSGSSFTDCYTDGTVTGGSQVGGFAGCTLESGMTATTSYYNGTAKATYRGWTGGFIGLIDKSDSEVEITNCASVGDCSNTGSGSPHYTAPFIAGNGATSGSPNAAITFSGNMYNTNATMDADTDWPSGNETDDGGSVETATGYAATYLQTETPYTNAGWNFTDVWTFDTSEGYLYPVLKQFGSLVTGINDLSVDKRGAAAYAVKAANNVLTVYGIEGTATVTVSTVAGQNVASVKTAEESATISLPGKGLYIVTVAGKAATQSYKIVNK